MLAAIYQTPFVGLFVSGVDLDASFAGFLCIHTNTCWAGQQFKDMWPIDDFALR
jgi:hypothetical protein